MGLDIGERRTGVAVTDEFQTIASPVSVVRRGPTELEALRILADEYAIEGIVAGLPRSLSGREGPQAAEVREFADAAAEALGLPLYYWDERLTTVQAERALIESGHRRDRRKTLVDAVAAAIMLQNYLDFRAAGRRR
jgi:putative Holliday junction resolvase